MAIEVRTSDAWKAVSACSVRVGGAWKLVLGVGVKVDGVWKQAFGTISPPGGDLVITIDKTSVEGVRQGAGSVTTDAVAVTVTPGTGTSPYTYVWTKVSGADFTINTPSAASTTFTRTMAAEEDISAVYKCTVTDNTGQEQEKTVTVNAESVAPLT